MSKNIKLKTKQNKITEKVVDINDLNLLNQAMVSLNNQNIMFINSTIKILVINNTIPTIIYKQLSKEYPTLKSILVLDTNSPKILSSNHRCQFNINPANFNYFTQSIISPLWYDFIKYHLSSKFMNDIFNIFSYSYSYSSYNNTNLEIDFQIGYNLPIFNNNYYLNSPSIKVDKDVLYMGWFLMRKDEDNSIGGNLEIFNHNINTNIKQKITTIPYQNNCLIILENIDNIENKMENVNQVYFAFSQKQITLHSQRYISFTIKQKK
jgi:hypothetical protein